MKLTYLWILFTVLFFSIGVNAQNQNSPSQIIKSLDSLKTIDSLANWIYARIDYSYNQPQQSLQFLMDTESGLWRKPNTNAEKEAALILYSNQGYNQLYSGNILESIDRYEKAYHYYIDHKLHVAGIIDYIFKPWANNYTRLGDYDKALFIQKQTLTYALKAQDHSLIAATYNNMAISYRSLGDLRQAEKLVQLGLKHTPVSSLSAILLNNTLADIFKESGNTDAAERLLKTNILRQTREPLSFESGYWLLSSYITAGDIQLIKRSYSDAARYYHLALSINNKLYNGQRLREKAYTTTQLGILSLKQKKGIEALNLFDETLNTLGLIAQGKIIEDKIFGDNRLVDVFVQRAQAYQLLGHKALALKDLLFALAAGDKIRLELADAKTKQRYQAEAKDRAEKAIGIAFELLAETKETQYAKSILALFEQTKSRTLLDQIRMARQQLKVKTKDPLFERKQSLESAIAFNEKQSIESSDPGLQNESRNAALKFKLDYTEKLIGTKYPVLGNKIQTESENSISLSYKNVSGQVIEYFTGKDHIYGLQLDKGRIRQIKRITNAGFHKTNISSFVNKFYQHGPTAMMNEPKQFYEESNAIYNTLLGGFHIPDNEKLTIVPDEFLGYLSFDGLITDAHYSPAISSWPFLLKKLRISYAFSLQTLVNSSVHKDKESIQRFTGIFITHENDHKGFIPAVAKEASLIKKKIAGEFLTDEKATSANFTKAFGESDVLHISTHSYLSGAQKEPTLAFDDGQMFLFELSTSLHVPALVVLSACQTADGMMAEGEGIISLSRGFAALGTKGTIAALWNVNDDAASVITADIYSGMLDGKNVGDALHRAKLNWLNGPRNGEQEYLPYYWDTLIYMGPDQQIKLVPPRSNVWWYILPVVALLIISLVSIRLLLKAGYLKK